MYLFVGVFVQSIFVLLGHETSPLGLVPLLDICMPLSKLSQRVDGTWKHRTPADFALEVSDSIDTFLQFDDRFGRRDWTVLSRISSRRRDLSNTDGSNLRSVPLAKHSVRSNKRSVCGTSHDVVCSPLFASSSAASFHLADTWYVGSSLGVARLDLGRRHPRSRMHLQRPTFGDLLLWFRGIRACVVEEGRRGWTSSRPV